MDLISGELTGTTLIGVLAVLALIDSTSFGTLLIPVWLLMSPGRVRVGRMLLYLGSIAGFYALIGFAILLGAGALSDTLATLADTRPFLIAQLVVGAALLAWSFKLEPIGGRKPAEAATVPSSTVPSAGGTTSGGTTSGGTTSGGTTSGGTTSGAADVAMSTSPTAAAAPGRAGRLSRWRERVLSSEAGSGRALAALAVGAGLVEVATMLPYLAALGLIGTQGPGWPVSGVWILGYCLVMIAPALVLTAARLFAAPLVERPLGRLDRWLTKNAASTTAWVVGIVGFLVARDAIGRLWGAG